MRRILFSAQGFGFGPTAKAAVVATWLQKYKSDIVMDFIGSGSAYELARSRKSIFTNIYNGKQLATIQEKIKNKYYDAVISVMAPQITLIAHVFHIPVFLIDSLYWFWDWRPDRIDFLSALKIQTLEDISAIFQQIHPHEQQFLAHHYASISYLQACFDEEKSSRNINHIKRKKIIAPIVDTSFISKKERNNDNTVVLSFCGQFNPIVDSGEVLDYCKLVLAVTRDAFIDLLKKTNNRLLIIGHPYVIENLPQIIKSLQFPDVDCEHLCYQDYYKTINSAAAIIAPPSLTTFYESCAYNKPLILLPEQHDGHWPNFKTITRYERKENTIFPGKMLTPMITDLNGMKENDIKSLYKKIRSINENQNNSLFIQLKNAYTQIINDISNASYRQTLMKKQKLYFEHYFSLPSTKAEEIILDIKEYLNESIRN